MRGLGPCLLFGYFPPPRSHVLDAIRSSRRWVSLPSLEAYMIKMVNAGPAPTETCRKTLKTKLIAL